MHRLIYGRMTTRRKPPSGDSVSCPMRSTLISGVGDTRKFEDIEERDAGPFAVADGAGHPLRSVCRTSLHQVEHSAVISGTLKIGNEGAAGEIRNLVVGQLNRIRNGIAFYGKPPVGYVQVHADGVVSDEEQVAWGDQSLHTAQGVLPGLCRHAG